MTNENPVAMRTLTSRRPVRRTAALLAGLGLACAGLLSGCSSSAVPAFDLTAAGRAPRGGTSAGGQLVVAEPSTIGTLEAERIVARDAAGSVSFVSDAQWADRLPRLFQARLIQSFENTSIIRAVGRPGDGVVADFQLNTELRAFQLDSARGEAFIEVSAKLIDLEGGKVVRARVFSGRAPIPSTAGAAVAQTLDAVLSTVLVDIVRWVGRK